MSIDLQCFLFSMQIILRLLRLCSPMEDGKECHKVKDQEIEERVRLLTSQFGNLEIWR
jgi:hypothetical protein